MGRTQVHSSRRWFIGLSLILITLTVGLTVFQTRQTQNLQSSAAKELKNCNIEENKIKNSDVEKKVLKKINDFRKERNLNPVEFQEDLNRSAAWMSADQGKQNKMSHKDSKNRNIEERVKDCGYTFAEIRENVGENTNDADAIFTAWRKSDDHRANMLCASCTQIGIAEDKKYWTLNIGSPLASVPSEEPEEDEKTETPNPSPEETEKPEDLKEDDNPPLSPNLSPAPQELPEGKTGIKPNVNIIGIGKNGNTNPLHPNRPITVRVVTPSGNEVANFEGVISYLSSPELFSAAMELPEDLGTGVYRVTVKIPYSLTQTISSGFISLTKDKLSELPEVILAPLDFNENNAITIADFFLFRNCLNDRCEEEKFDVNDDGVVDILDYNVIVTYFATEQGE